MTEYLTSQLSKKCHWATLPKMCQKLNFSQIWHFLYLPKSFFVYWSRQENVNFWPSWVFGPFLAIWLSDIFWTWPENKKWFLSQKDHFLFTEQPFLMARKIGCISNPKLLWNILLLRPDVEDFKTLFFRTSMGSPLML